MVRFQDHPPSRFGRLTVFAVLRRLAVFRFLNRPFQPFSVSSFYRLGITLVLFRFPFPFSRGEPATGRPPPT